MAFFTCQRCGESFELSQRILDRYPGWTPKLCRACRDASGDRGTQPKPQRRAASGTAGRISSPQEVLATFTDGPDSGVFTDGSAVPNPGPGGWGAVYVVDGEIQAEAHGASPDTTNNRMELTALIEGCRLVPVGIAAVVYTDSNLVARTLNEWAEGWKQRGWKRKGGEIKNLDLVQEAYALVTSRPELSVEWIRAHVGYRWNEYADALSNLWRLE